MPGLSLLQHGDALATLDYINTFEFGYNSLLLDWLRESVLGLFDRFEHLIVLLGEILHLEFTLFVTIFHNFSVSHEIEFKVLLVVDLEVLLHLKLERAWLLQGGRLVGGAWLLQGGRLVGGVLGNWSSLELVGGRWWHVIFVDLGFVDGHGGEFGSVIILVQIFLHNFIRSVNPRGISTGHVRSTKLSSGILLSCTQSLASSEGVLSSWNLVARVVASSFVLLTELDFPIIVQKRWLSNLDVFDSFNVLLWALVTLAAVLFLEFKLCSLSRFRRCFGIEDTLKVRFNLSDFLIHDNSWFLSNVNYAWFGNKGGGSGSNKNFRFNNRWSLLNWLHGFMLTTWNDLCHTCRYGISESWLGDNLSYFGLSSYCGGLCYVLGCSFNLGFLNLVFIHVITYFFAKVFYFFIYNFCKIQRF